MMKWLLLALLVVPTASAYSAAVDLTAAGTVWNGESSITIPQADAAREVQLWLPPNARVHDVEVRLPEGGGSAAWSAASADAIAVNVSAEATRVSVHFDIIDKKPYLTRVVVPPGVDAIAIAVHPANGMAAMSPDATFSNDVLSGPTTPGRAYAIAAVDADRVGELSLFVTVGGFAILVLLGTLLWHRFFPPNEGKPPEKFLDHLVELQARLVPPVLIFGFFSAFYFTSGLRQVGRFVIPTFSPDSSVSARAFEALTERLVPPDVQLVVLRPSDAVLAQLGMCLFLAFVTALPVLVYEIGAFVGPALAPREKNLAASVLAPVTGLFVAGSLLGYLVMAPYMIRTLYAYAPGIGAAPLLAVGDLVSFALLVILSLGVAFELPVVMFVLSRMGVVTAKDFAKYVRHAIVAIVIVAGIITPDPTVVSQLMLAVPIIGLYLLGIGAAAWGERKRAAVAT